MTGHSMLAGLVFAASAPQLVDARFDWYLGYGGASCHDACAGFDMTCVPAKLPRDIIEMQSVTMQSHLACANIQKVTTNSMEAFAPAFTPPTSAGHNGICYYPKGTDMGTGHLDCAAAPPTCTTGSGNCAESMMQRFCACSEVKGIQWLLGNEGANCDATCRDRGGMCDNAGTDTWPDDRAGLAKAALSAGVHCSSHSFGTSDASPSIGNSGACHWRSNNAIPTCSASDSGVRRLCPCYDVSNNHAV